jgi:uncharacterized membrane protein HdeD (DUF308 family)
LSAVRGLVAVVLALAVMVAGRGTARLVTFLGLYWMVGGLITLRFALAIRPWRRTRLALIAGMVAVGGAILLLLRVLGGFAAERQLGRRWTVGAIVLGTMEVALGGMLLLSTDVDANVLAPIIAGWGLVSGTLLVAEGLRLRRLNVAGLPGVGSG